MQDVPVREDLEKVYQALHDALPDVQEKISWSMPTWYDKHNIIHFAASKKHIGLYPGPEAVEHFAEELKDRGLDSSKGTIRIPYGDDLPLDLIREIARWCRETGNHA
jgi:uncharacterized protein YdhG (YjbR/CyaY superfamily)